jgi:hypothetical protein
MCLLDGQTGPLYLRRKEVVEIVDSIPYCVHLQLELFLSFQ